jgi:hypothetical protein
MEKFRAILAAHGPNVYFAVREVKDDTLEGLQAKVKDFVDRNGIAADHFKGGQVFDESMSCIGRITHDGKFQPENM